MSIDALKTTQILQNEFPEFSGILADYREFVGSDFPGTLYLLFFEIIRFAAEEWADTKVPEEKKVLPRLFRLIERLIVEGNSGVQDMCVIQLREAFGEPPLSTLNVEHLLGLNSRAEVSSYLRWLNRDRPHTFKGEQETN